MASLKTKFSVGLFLLIGIAIIIVGIIWLGVTNYFEKGRYFSAYFDESVQGLAKDSPVKYRGVSIGRVYKLDVAPDERLIEVILKIESTIDPQATTHDIVAQLKSVGITGLMFIELERKEPGERDLSPAITFDPPHPVIPTRPSEISKIFQGIEDVINVFRSLDTRAISDKTVQALEKINATLDAAQLVEIVSDLRGAIKNLRDALNTDRLDHMLASLEQTSGSLNSMVVNANDGITDIRAMVAGLDKVVAASGRRVEGAAADLEASAEQIRLAMETSAVLLTGAEQKIDVLERRISMTLNHIDQASRLLNRFLDHIAEQPSQLIFSGPAHEKPTAP